MSKDTAAFCRELERRGYQVEYGGHIKVRAPDGRLVAIASKTQHGGRGLANFKAIIRRFEKGEENSEGSRLESPR